MNSYVSLLLVTLTSILLQHSLSIDAVRQLANVSFPKLAIILSWAEAAEKMNFSVFFKLQWDHPKRQNHAADATN